MMVGPDAAREDSVVGLMHVLTGAHETLAVGTIFPDENGKPSVHMHAACGREGRATVGCTRAGLGTWLVGEAVLLEILDSRRTARSTPPHRVRSPYTELTMAGPMTRDRCIALPP